MVRKTTKKLKSNLLELDIYGSSVAISRQYDYLICLITVWSLQQPFKYNHLDVTILS